MENYPPFKLNSLINSFFSFSRFLKRIITNLCGIREIFLFLNVFEATFELLHPEGGRFSHH